MENTSGSTKKSAVLPQHKYYTENVCAHIVSIGNNLHFRNKLTD